MLGKIDFANAPTFEPVPGGEYPGQTKSWELKNNQENDGQHVAAQFTFEFDDDLTGETKTRTQYVRWSLKPDALWRIKRDLVDLGADPELFNSEAVDLAPILNDTFSPPRPVLLTLDVDEYTPRGGGEKRKQNVVRRLALRNS